MKSGSMRVSRFFGVITLLLCIGCRNHDLEKGNSSLALGDYPLAIRFFEKAVIDDPKSYEARLGLGEALLQKAIAENDNTLFTSALLQFEACRSLIPSQDISALLGETYTERVRVLLNRRDTLMALNTLTKAIESTPNSAQPFNLAGIIYGKLGDIHKAEALFRKALDLDSTDASAHFNLGMILWQTGDYRSAHTQWLKALKAAPKDEDILYWFALSEKKMKELP